VSPHSSPKRILVVDDFEPWRLWIRSQLALWNCCQISEAADGQDAVRKARELKPDLILLDIGLPGMNGIEVAEQIRQTGVASEIVFLTVEHDAEVRKAAIDIGARGYVLKTCAARDLSSVLGAARGDGPEHQVPTTASLDGLPE
jgi:DNA-binding NarL/FixJ family response regulator